MASESLTWESESDWDDAQSEEDVSHSGSDLELAEGETIDAFEDTGDHTWDNPGVDEVEVLVVAGGGGGSAGGGGGGGVVFESGISTGGNDYDVVVGAGGARHLSADGDFIDGAADNGDDSYFDQGGSDELHAKGGGGGEGNTGTGIDGGSAGAAGPNSDGSGGSATQPGTNSDADTDAGNDGGSSVNGSRPNAVGGAGGAGEAGEDSNDYMKPGDGGDGLDFSDEFGTDYGDDGWFGGGGAGGGLNDNPDAYVADNDIASGGKGGGADGGRNRDFDTPDGPVPNSGGGGRHDTYDNFGSTDGADGIVLIKYNEYEADGSLTTTKQVS